MFGGGVGSIDHHVNQSPTSPSSTTSSIGGEVGGFAAPVGLTSTTTSLLKEISSLRLRLRDLEDDTKSSVISAGGNNNSSMDESRHPASFTIMLKKELAKVEQEKANLEREYMNQMASLSLENKSIVADLQSKLATSEQYNKELSQKLSSVSSRQQDRDVERDKWMMRLEEERRNHEAELERWKQNMTAADMEIADGRRELDQLHETLEEVAAHKETLLDEVTRIRVDLHEERRKTQAMQVELRDCHDTVEKLHDDIRDKSGLVQRQQGEMTAMKDRMKASESQRERVTGENQELRKRLQSEEARGSQLKSRLKELQQVASARQSNDSTLQHQQEAQRKQWETEKRAFEDRVFQLQTNLQEKDEAIDTLSLTLADERRVCLNLRTEVKHLKDDSNQRNARSSSRNATPVLSTDSPKDSEELAQLREQNKLLQDEVKALRHQKAQYRDLSPSRTRSTLSEGSSSSSISSMEIHPVASSPPVSQKSWRAPAGPSTPPSLFISTNVRNKSDGEGGAATTASAVSPKSPRTPVSGLVANFERRIAKSTTSPVNGEQTTRSSSPEYNDGERDKWLTELENEQKMVTELREALRKERDSVRELRTSLSMAKKQTVSPSVLESKMRDTQQEVETLVSKVKQYETSIVELEDRLTKQETDNKHLQRRLELAAQDKQRIEERTQASRTETERLQRELNCSSVQEEKKDENQHEYDEQLQRLRSQVEALQHELERALTELEKRDAEIDELKTVLQETEVRLTKEAFQEAMKRQNQHERELQAVTKQLDKLQQAKTKLENDYSIKANELQALQAEFQSIKNGNQESLHRKKERDIEMNKLTVELTKVQMSKAELETTYQNRMREMEQELQALEQGADEELSAMRGEIDSFQKTLSYKDEEIKRLQAEKAHLCSSMNDASYSRKDEIDELHSELMDLTAKATSQSREIQSLKMKIEELQAAKAEAERKYQQRMSGLEEELKAMDWASRHHIHKDDVDSLRSENQRLRDAVRDVKLERRLLQERLDAVVSEKSTSKSAQVLRERNLALKQEVDKLTKRLKKMEASITRFAI